MSPSITVTLTMHTQKDGLHPGAARKEAITRSRTTLTMTPETKGVLRRMGNGSMSDGVYLATQIVTQLLKRKILCSRRVSSPLDLATAQALVELS